ncbi:type II toxin-antitoxin system VapC family toxin [Thalassobaculum sp.]|uniref:type II toxin-antitoxin system VapC family toxin n=1 Tax=Thalassobaculum sp. TaxID=2022740 RepID=UPI0032F0537F
MTVFMLDTDICSYVIRRRPEAVRGHLAQAAARGDRIVISSITYFEMRRGAAGPKASPRLGGEIDAFCARLHEVLPFDRAAADAAAALGAALAARGLAIGGNDTLIAGHALAAGCTVVTNNRREFGRVEGLAVEDWAG